MTMIDTLFGLIPAASRGQQWVADELQLVNWGGYDGAHRVRFSPTATLLCGGSGSGKSTLMDAYIALMMPHTTPFNGASNGGVTGRPRGEEQRNILSYGRGKIDESRTEEGTQLRVLRGDGVDTWTAIAMTWQDHDGSLFTALRAWYIPATARVLEDTVKVRATIAGPFALDTLQAAAGERFSDAAVRATGLDTLATDREFSAKLHSVLGIGAAGAGAKAMSLLARIQAGQQITTVDELYKRMVLEEPETLATADAVVEHFDELESTRQRMLTAQKQVRALHPIRDMRARIEHSADRLRLIDEIGRFGDPGSLASLWRTSHRLELLREAERELLQRTQSAGFEVRTQQSLVAAAEAEQDGLAEVLRNSGGDRLETAQRELHGAEQRLVAVERERERFDVATAVFGERIGTKQAFAAFLAQARASLADTNAKETARASFVAAMAERTALRKRSEALEAELRDAEHSQNSIPAALLRSRELLADAAGLSVDELPFVGELVEVRTEFEPWREAFNLALGGFATTLLIDVAHLSSFRSAINAVQTPQRLRFEGVPTGLNAHGRLDPEALPGRLDYRDGPFAGWLRERLERQFGYVCVDTAAELGRHQLALTITGQLSQGNSGAHGGQGRRNVLGFSGRHRYAELEGEFASVQHQFELATQAAAEATAALDAFEDRSAAYRHVVELSWEQLDVPRATADRDKWSGIIHELTEGNPEIAALKRKVDEAKKRAATARQALATAEVELSNVETRWSAITDEVDDAQRVVDDAEDAGRALDAAQTRYLDERFDVDDAVTLHTNGNEATSSQQQHQQSPSAALAAFDAALQTASKRLLEDQDAAQQQLEEQRDALRRAFEAFLDSWPNPGLRADPDTSFKDFERILTELETSGLHELENEWKQSLIKLSGNDLTNLDSTLGRSLREIRERIEPINHIMQDLPFYDDEHRLKITPRENQSEQRRRFRKELRDVRELIGSATSDVDRAQAYERMARLISRIRRSAPDFAELIDVRNHVRVSAEKFHAASGRHDALYDHIGEKSGGESQELIAFIVGAALRYQLGDAGAERPRYAPVFLDEALIKADARFTERAIGAWRGLGFQLVIGAPNDKYSAIEPHVDVEYDILKDTSGRSWAKPKVALPVEAA